MMDSGVKRIRKESVKSKLIDCLSFRTDGASDEGG
jgi:hypothetical protein